MTPTTTPVSANGINEETPDVLRLTLDNLPAPREVDLFGHAFVLKRVTRSVQMELEKIQRELNATDDDADADGVVGIFGRGIAALLKPNGHKTTAAKIVMERWKADELSLSQITGFFDRVQESAAADRPI